MNKYKILFSAKLYVIKRILLKCNIKILIIVLLTGKV